MSSDEIVPNDRNTAAESDEMPLSETALAILALAIHSRRISTAIDTAEEITPDTWVAYLTGSLLPEQSRSLTRRIAQDGALRQQMRQAVRELRSAQTRPWSSATRFENAAITSPTIADAWRRQIVLRTQQAANAFSTRLREQWDWIREQVSSDSPGAITIWSAFQADARRVLGSENDRAPSASIPIAPLMSGVALARGAPLRSITVVNGSEAWVRRAETAADGSAYFDVYWESAAPEGETVYLGMRGTVYGWILSATRCQQGRCTWIVPQLGTALSLPVGPLALDAFFLSVGPYATTSDPDSFLLPTQVTAADGTSVTGIPVSVKSLRIEKNLCHFRLTLPGEIFDQHQTFWLAIDLHLAPHQVQRLGEWPLAEWTTEAQEVSVPLPDFAEGVPMLISLLTASLFQKDEST